MILNITNANRFITIPSKICKSRPVLNSSNYFIGLWIWVFKEIVICGLINSSHLNFTEVFTKQNNLSEPGRLIYNIIGMKYYFRNKIEDAA